jgi:serine/threonine-protein kinase RsbW
MMPLAITATKQTANDSALEFPAKVSIPSDPTEARLVQEAIELALKTHRYSEKEIFGIRLALEEALLNAIKHGNQLDRGKKVHISYHVRPEHVEITIADEGAGFDPEEVPDPTAPENLERCCGRGLMLMRHYMSEVAFNRRGNSVSMRKLRK